MNHSSMNGCAGVDEPDKGGVKPFILVFSTFILEVELSSLRYEMYSHATFHPSYKSKGFVYKFNIRWMFIILQAKPSRARILSGVATISFLIFLFCHGAQGCDTKWKSYPSTQFFDLHNIMAALPVLCVG